MQLKHFLATVLVGAIALGGMTVSVTGCDQKEEKEEDDDGKKKKKKKKDDDEEDEEKPAATAEAATSDEAQPCDGMVKIGGLRKVLRPLGVYVAADSTSKRLTGLAKGTHVELKYQCGSWIMLNYPSGVGEMSPGWVHVGLHSSKWKDETEEDKKKDEEEKKDDEEEKKDDEEEKKDDEEEKKDDEEEKKDDEEEKKDDEEEKKDDEEEKPEEKPPPVRGG